ncbi:MAG: SGNH/GDSL hydrolase family protein [Bacteroidota bacterium]
MKKKALIVLLGIICFACQPDDTDAPPIPRTFNMLSLGDSYTKGEGVCETCGYPVQLKDSLKTRFNTQDIFNLKVIAETGWNTMNLIDGIATETLTNNYDLVTLLIGVNNQFQNRPFSWFEEDFPELVNTATTLARGNKANVIIITIPDYANTGFGQAFGGPTITEELTEYNAYIQNYCLENQYSFIDAQDLIFAGLTNPELLAPDNLHPSELAYSTLVTQLLPMAFDILME